MYEYLKRSDAGWHVKKNKPQENGTKEQGLTGYKPTAKEKMDGEEPVQRSKVENSYGQVSLGVSKGGKTTLIISGKKEKTQTPVNGEKREIEGDRLSRKSRKVYTGNRGASESVLVYRGDMDMAYKKRRMLGHIQKALNDEPSEMVGLQMPFLQVRQDEKRLRALTEKRLELMGRKRPGQLKTQQGAADTHGPDAYGINLKQLDLEKEQLSREVEIKKKLRRDMMRNLTASIEKDKQTPQSSLNVLQWLNRFMSLADTGASAQDGAGGKDEDDDSGDFDDNEDIEEQK